MDNELLRSHDGHVTHLTLNRPQKSNALCASLVEALLNAVEYAHTDGTRLLILDANGDNFCTGFDFSGYLEASEGDLVLLFIRIEHLLQLLYHAPFATVALAHGKNRGAGADLVCACSMRVAAAGTTFRMPGLRFGIVLGARRLAHRIRTDAASEALASGRTFDANAALELHFITRIAALRVAGADRRGAQGVERTHAAGDRAPQRAGRNRHPRRRHGGTGAVRERARTQRTNPHVQRKQIMRESR